MALDMYLDALAEALANRRRVIEDTDEINKLILESEIPDKEYVEGIPTLNMPEALEKRSFIRVRLFQSFFGQRPVATFSAVKGKDSQTGIDWFECARKFTDLFDHDSRTLLHVPPTMRQVICEMVDYGIGGWKVTVQPNQNYDNKLYPSWDFVSIRDFLWPDGMGLDVQKMPWCGQIVRLTEAEVRARLSQNLYTDSAAVQKILDWKEGDEWDINPLSTAWNEINGSVFLESKSREFIFGEIYYTREDGTSMVGEIHLPSGLVVREIESPFGKRKPFFFARLDERTALSFLGYGVVDKLGTVNKVVNGIFNSALASAIVALQQVRLVRANSGIAKVLFGSDRTLQVGPNFQAVTESPRDDLAIVPLGDPRAAVVAVQLLPMLQRYADRMFGTLDGQMGNVAATRRSPAYGVNAVLEEGSMPIRDLMQRLAEPFAEAVTFTLELYDDADIKDRAIEVLGDDGQIIVQAFSIKGDIRKALKLDVKVVEPSSTREAESQRAMQQTQMVGGWVNQLIQLGNLMINPQILPSVRQMYIDASMFMYENMRRALESGGGVQDVSKILPDPETIMGPVKQEADEFQQQQQQMQLTLMQKQMAEQQQGGGNGTGNPTQG